MDWEKINREREEYFRKDKRYAWLKDLRPGDEVLVLHSHPSVTPRTGVVIRDEKLISRDARGGVDWLAVECGYDKPVHFRLDGGHEGFPFGSPAYCGDLSRIFPVDCDVQEMIDRLRLEYAFRPNELEGMKNPPWELSIGTVRKILRAIAEG